MRIAIASGKGGTGKTTVATNLAFIASSDGRKVAYLDCDVEEPNGHLFLKPEILERKAVGDLVPVVDADLCTVCGKCAEICQYNAIACVGDKALIYPELCHGCGGCALVCPVEAISEENREMGILETGHVGPIQFAHGILNVGEVRAIPVIKAVRSVPFESDLFLLDAPPGTSCPVVESVHGVDFVVLVTEPTPFGFHDLKLAVEMVHALKLPMGVVVNRASFNGVDIRSYCEARRIPLLAEIPDDQELAEAYSRGEMACEALPRYQDIFTRLLETIVQKAGEENGGF